MSWLHLWHWERSLLLKVLRNTFLLISVFLMIYLRYQGIVPIVAVVLLAVIFLFFLYRFIKSCKETDEHLDRLLNHENVKETVGP